MRWLPKMLSASSEAVIEDRPARSTRVASDKEPGLVADDVPVNPKADANVGPAAAVGDVGPAAASAGSDDVDAGAQHGVQMAEATTKIWTKKHLVAAYIFIWIIYFVDAMQQGVSTTLSPYVTSAFAEHSLTPTVTVLSSIIGGLTKLPLAKVLDIWGRPQGYVLCILLLTLGLVMMAACRNVQTYAAAQVFYWVGYNGISYTISVFIGDTSSLKNRAIMFAYVSSPFVVTVWISGPIAQSFLRGAGWRWAFGTFAVLTPVICLPLFFLFAYNYRRAKAAGLMPRTPAGAVDGGERGQQRGRWVTVRHYAVEFDAVGLLLVVTGLALFLLPFNIYAQQSEQWRSPLIISLLVVGTALLGAFVAWERFVAPTTFIPYALLTDRTVLGGCVLSGALFVSFYIWDNYFTSFLQVVNGLSITRASYVANIYSVGSCFWSVPVGGLIRLTGRFKWLALYFGVPLTALGVGLMIAFRRPDQPLAGVVVCQVLIAVAGGTLVICEQMAVMAAASHRHLAVVLAVEAMFAAIGGAIGSTVAAAIWSGVFPRSLSRRLPPGGPDPAVIYANLSAQLSFPIGSPERTAIAAAYGDAQKIMLCASTAVLAVAFFSVVVWRDIKVKDFKQVKGLVV